MSLVVAFALVAVGAAEPILLTGHTEAVMALAFSADGTRLATGARDKTVFIWNVATHERVQTLAIEEMQASALAFSPDGSTLAVGDRVLQVRLFDVATGKERLKIAHPGSVAEVVFSPDGKQLAVSAVNGNAAVYTVADGKTVRSLLGKSVAFSADAKFVWVGSSNGVLSLTELSTGKTKQTLTTGTTPMFFRATGSRTQLYGFRPNAPTVWKFEGTPLKEAAQLTPTNADGISLASIAVTDDGSRLVASSERALFVWDLKKAELMARLPINARSFAAMTNDGAVVAATEGSTVKLFTIAPAK